jgi:hypothetical protein
MIILLSIQQFLVNLFGTLTTIFKIILWSGFKIKPSLENNEENCLILGNGPSLEKSISENKDSMTKMTILSVNYFAETSLFKILKPSLYVVNAPEMWLDEVDAVYLDKSEKLFKIITEETCWHMDFFIPYRAKNFTRWQKILAQNKNIRINYFNSTPIEGFKWFRYFSYNRYLGMPRPHNVLIPSLMLCLALRFKKIYLFGADHSWMKDISVTEGNEVLLNQKHFYDKDTSKAKSMHHLGKGNRKMHEVLQKFVYAFQGYFEINDYSIYRGQEIINCTEGSYIDAFRRSKVID